MTATPANPFDIFSPQAQGNHSLYAQMRIHDPVHCAVHPNTGDKIWFLTAYDDCVSFMRNKRFGKTNLAAAQTSSAPSSAAIETQAIINRHMLNLDEPDHARLKSLVHKAFTPNRISDLRFQLQIIADSLLEGVEHDIAIGSDFDLTEHYAGVLPLKAIIAMLGLPLSDYGQLRLWTQAMLHQSHEDTAHGAIVAFSMYLHGQIDLRQGTLATADDLLTGLIVAEDAGDRLTRQELVAMIFLLFAAGYETMTSFISNGMLLLLEHPEQMQLLRDNLDNPVVVRSAVEEMLRYNGPSYMTLPSWATEDVVLGGKIIRYGECVHAVLHAANRDPAIFEHPNTFDILRHPNRHIAFSQGIHHCLGAPLARLEGEIAFTTLLRWMPVG